MDSAGRSGAQMTTTTIIGLVALCVLGFAITDLTITKSHLGKATLYDLPKVHYSAAGKADSIAWCLPDPHAWKNKIEELKGECSTH